MSDNTENTETNPEKLQHQQEIMQLKHSIEMLQIDLYLLCQQYQEKYKEDLSIAPETILLNPPKKKRGRPKKEI
jgi:hypothetical protein